MGTKNNPGAYDCYANLHPDEPHFVLKSTDPFGPGLVDMWAALRDGDVQEALEAFAGLVDARKLGDVLMNPKPEKTREARQCSADMRAWKDQHPDE
jgi:hypothetical protein